MNEETIYLPTYYIHQIGEQLATYNIDVGHWLALSGIKTNDIDQPGQSISLSQFKSLINDAIKLSKQPSMGLLVGNRLGLTAHGMLGYAISASSCLREAVELLSRYLNTRTPLLRVELSSDEKELTIILHECYPLQAIKIPFLESAIFTLYNLLMQVTQNSAPIREIGFPFPAPNYFPSYSDFFKYPLAFDQKVASISLLLSEIDKPLMMADKISLQQAKSICELELTKLQEKELLSSRIRKYLLSFENGFPTLYSVSNNFYFSPRTLHRNLNKEGTSFSLILQSVRTFRAVELLINTQQTIQAIALTLGYSDVANFRKAFKQWKGISPSEFRKGSLCN